MKLTNSGFSLWADVRYACRGLKSAPGYAVTLVLTLALGLGAATTMLAIVNSVLLRPVALPHPEQMVVLFREVHGTKEYSLSFPQIHALNADPAPDQGFIWAMPKTPFETHTAAPVQNGTNYLKKIGPGLVSLINSNLASHHLAGNAKWSTNGLVILRGVFFFSPYVQAIRTPESDFLLGSLVPQPPGKEPMPPALMHEIMSRPSLVCYDWEITEQRLAEWRPLSQVYLIASRVPLPSTNSPAQKWLFSAQPKLGNCGTEITLTAPNELTLIRNSTIGLSAVELTWLALWLESPGFPLDYHYESPAPQPREQVIPRRATAPSPH